MRPRSVLSFIILIASLFFIISFFTSLSLADVFEQDQIKETIVHKKARWLPRDTPLSRLDREQRAKRFGSATPVPTGAEQLIVAPAISLPSKLDWRDYHGASYVTSVRDQGDCGACWVFAATAALESKALISGDPIVEPLDLSEQALLSCSGAGNCYGGRIDLASDFIRDIGIPQEVCYPYTSTDCFCSNVCPEWPGSAYRISDWYFVDPTIESIRYSLYHYGPLVVLMAAHTDILYYGSGIYTHAWGDLEGYHAALLVGYDDEEQCFIVKDSWGTDWGEKGYLRIAYSEVSSETMFGSHTIAYKNDIPEGFPLIDGIPRNTVVADRHSVALGRAAPLSFLSGIIRDTSGDPIGNAFVKIGQYFAATDSSGQYRLPAIPPGDHVITITKNGYSMLSTNVTTLPGSSLKKDFVLNRIDADRTKEREAGGKEREKGSPTKRQQGPGRSGWMLLQGMPVTPGQAEAHFSARRTERLTGQPLMATLATMGAAEISTEIRELARALRHDPKAIYNYVKQNIDYLPYFGSLKGATLTYLDGSGNDFDQASLMIALLRAGGYNARYVYGTMKIDIGTVNYWLRNTYYAYTLANGGIPFTADSPAFYATITRVWVAATIDGIEYVFDPALKIYTENYDGHIDLSSDTGYNYDDFMASAVSGATLGNDYAQNINEGNIRSRLAYYASNYIAARRAEGAKQDTKRYLGNSYRVVWADMTAYSTSLPYPTSVIAVWDEIPPEYTATLRVQYSGIDHTFTVPQIGGRRITITYADSNYRPELRLDGTLLASGGATTPGSISTATFTINHGTATNNGYYASQAATSSLKSGGVYALITNFAGTPGSALIQRRQEQLDQYLLQGLTAGNDKEKVLGETLNIMGLSYFNEKSMQEELIGSGIISGGALPVMFHAIGIMGQRTGPYIDVAAWACALNYAYGSYDQYYNNAKNIYALFQTMMFHGSGFEHSILEQFMGSDKPAASTVKVLQLANAGGYRIFQADSSNYQTVRQQLKGYSSTALADIDAKKNEGFDVFVLPEYGNLTLGQWQGYGYMARDSDWVSGMYVSNYNGGIGQNIPIDPFNTAQYMDTLLSVDTPERLTTSTLSNILPKLSNEPVDMASGAYLYDHADLKLGGDAPLGLTLARSYNSNNRARRSGLGYGWTHNNDIRLNTASHAGPAIGRRQITEAAPFVVAVYVINSIMRNESHVKDTVISALVAKWAMDQINDNSVAIQAGSRNMEFIRLPDGSYSAPRGITTELIKNTDGTFSLVERSGTRTTFNADRRIREIMDIDGNTMTFAYNANKDLSSVRDARGRTLTFSYSGDAISSVFDPAGRSVSYTYDASGNLTGCTDPEGKWWSYGYDEGHRMTHLANPLGITTAVNVYDGLGRVMTQTVPRQGGKTAMYGFYFSGPRNQEEDPAGGTITYYFDEKGRGYADVDPLGNRTAKEFDGQDHIVGVIDPRSYKTTYTYDNNHNLKTITNPLNEHINKYYDGYFRLTHVYDPLGYGTRFFYDAKHHLISVQDPLGNTTSSTFYADGLINTAADARGTTTAFAYDAYGNPQTAQTGSHPAVTTAYDTIGRLTAFADQAGSTTTFAYDRRGLLAGRTDPTGKTVGFDYDGAGRLIAKRDRNGRVVTYTYTPTDKIETITYQDDSRVRFAYDLLDKLVSMEDGTGTTYYSYDAAGRLVAVTDPQGFAISYGYDAAGNVTEITYPGNKKALYSYDHANRLAAVTWQDRTARYTYDVVGRPVGLIHFNGSATAYSYDRAGRITKLDNYGPDSVDPSGRAISRYEFTLDANGNRTGAVQEEPHRTALSQEDISYTYDARNNRLMTAGGDSFAYDDEGRLTNGYGATYAFDDEHRLTEVGNDVRFIYDGRGNRVEAVRNGIVTRYIYDTGGNLLAEADGENRITRYYIHGKGLMAMTTPDEKTYCYHFNATGSTIAITDDAGNMVNSYAYDPFGKMTDRQEYVQQPFTFVGQYGVMTEPNGFYYMRARYYDPSVGRFISEDPIGLDGGDVNLYAYAGNNPVMGIDPDGKLAFYWHFGITLAAGVNSGLSVTDSTKLAWKAMAVDFASGSLGTSSAVVVQHAMGLPGQSPAEIIAATNAYIRNSSTPLANAIHATQDLATPAHAGHVWTGFELSWDTVNHIVGDIFPSLGTISQAYQGTINLLDPGRGGGCK